MNIFILILNIFILFIQVYLFTQSLEIQKDLETLYDKYFLKLEDEFERKRGKLDVTDILDGVRRNS